MTKKTETSLKKDMFTLVKKHNAKAIIILSTTNDGELVTNWHYDLSALLSITNYLNNLLIIKNGLVRNDMTEMLCGRTEKDINISMINSQDKKKNYFG